MSSPWMAVGVVGEGGTVEQRRIIEVLVDYGPWEKEPGVPQSRPRYIKYRYEHRHLKPRSGPLSRLQPWDQIGWCTYSESEWRLDGVELASQL